MFWNPFRPKKPSSNAAVAAPVPRFLGEPSGPGIPMLKIQLAKVLADEGNTRTAYLTNAVPAGQAEQRLTLVLSGRAPEAQMAAAIAPGCRLLGPIDLVFESTLTPATLEQLRAEVTPLFPVPGLDNKLFQINVQVAGGAASELPPEFAGAYVPVFVAAANADAAAHAMAARLSKHGYRLLDIPDKKIHVLDPYQWGHYLLQVWPDHQTTFPSQQDVLAGLPFDHIFFGPFACYTAAEALRPVGKRA